MGGLNGPLAFEAFLKKLRKGTLSGWRDTRFVALPLQELLERLVGATPGPEIEQTIQDARLVDVEARIHEGFELEGNVQLYGLEGHARLLVPASGGARLLMPVGPFSLGAMKISGTRATATAQLELEAPQDGQLSLHLRGRVSLLGLDNVGAFPLTDEGFSWTLSGAGRNRSGFEYNVTVQGADIIEPEGVRVEVSIDSGVEALARAFQERCIRLIKRAAVEKQRVIRVRQSTEDQVGRLSPELRQVVDTVLEDRAIARSDLNIARREFALAGARYSRLEAEEIYHQTRDEAARRRLVVRASVLDRDARIAEQELLPLERSPRALRTQRAFKVVEQAARFRLDRAQREGEKVKKMLAAPDASVSEVREEKEAATRALNAAEGMVAVTEGSIDEGPIELDERITEALDRESFSAEDLRQRTMAIISAMDAESVLDGMVELALAQEEDAAISVLGLEVDVPLMLVTGRKISGILEVHSSDGPLRVDCKIDLSSPPGSAFGMTEMLLGTNERKAAQAGAMLLNACSSRLRYAEALRQARVGAASEQEVQETKEALETVIALLTKADPED